MAAAAVGGAFLTAFIDVVFDRLASPEVVNFIRGKKLDPKLLQRLKTALTAVRAVLNDAEKKQIRDPDVNRWLDDLKDAVYEADDALDEVATKAVTQKEVSNLLSRLFNLPDRQMVPKLEEIVDKLDSIWKRKEILDLKEIAPENWSSRSRTPSTSLEDRSHIYGRDKDKEEIMELLLDDNSDGEVSVIPIVGMGGVGKTTLAQLVYNDDHLEQIFNFKAWVCVSEEFDILKVTKTITKAVSGGPCDENDLNLLQLNLKDKLKGKKFLIVLDDVWNEDYLKWSHLKKPLEHGIRGSKILVTTRHENVATVVRTVDRAHPLCLLSDEHCWRVFAKHACLPLHSGENMDLEKIGRQIAKKCKGLPLAAQSLGGMLRMEHDITKWSNILDSDIWEFSEEKCQIIPALRISYHYLPSYLKRCFVYCSLYPKDYEFDKDELILLWMAEDLLQLSKKEKTLEEVGYAYFDDLASRSFFQHSSTGQEYFVMHDLMHDLATFLGGDFYFRSEELGKETKIGSKTRHLSFSTFSHPILENFEVFDKAQFLRTFLPIHFKYAEFKNEKAPFIILSKFKYLRVLSFRGFQNLDALPDPIGELIHLRYLDLSETRITTLPNSLCNLYNLQTLKLHGDRKKNRLKLYYCHNLTMLPNDMQNLVNLRHLDISGTGLKEMPRGMGKLKHLQYLSCFVVGKHEENGIKELGELSNLHGSLSIQKLENVIKSSEASKARLFDKKFIKDLSLAWSSSDDFTDSHTEIDILCKLQPHQGLQSLSITLYRGTKFPNWVGHSSYHNMTELSLYSCDNCCMLPSLGQLPSLKKLSIKHFNLLETIGAGFYKNDDSSSSVMPFLSLEYLEFRDMPCWEVWSSFESDAFPQLKKLTLVSCPKLRGHLPNYLPALENLYISGCEQLASSLPRAPSIQSLAISESNKVGLQEIPLSVERLTIEGSPLVVESMLEALTNTQPTSLRSLYIWKCSSALSFPGGCIPASLRNLDIRNFSKLEFPKQHQHVLLESLFIDNSCDSLTSFPLETFPNLKRLDIRGCQNLVSISVPQDAALQHLSSFSIFDCPNFVSFPREGLPAPSLTSFRVYDCGKLKSLPCQMNTLLPKLEELAIENCLQIESFPEGGVPPNLKSIYITNCSKLKSLPCQMNTLLPKLEKLEIRKCVPIESFPEGGMPPNLKSIYMTNCEKLLSGLASMDMLTRLHIEGPCDGIKSFPNEGLLPASLTSLELTKLSSLETLDCKGLLHLTSLQQLSIWGCQKLENMAGERMPASLKLVICGCPLLEERCHPKHSHIWPKISHVRGIYVKWRWIS